MNILIDDDKIILLILCSIILLLSCGFFFGYFVGAVGNNTRWESSIVANRKCQIEIERASLIVYRVQNDRK